MFDDGRFDSLLRKFVIVQNIFPRKTLHNIFKVENWKYMSKVTGNYFFQANLCQAGLNEQLLNATASLLL